MRFIIGLLGLLVLAYIVRKHVDRAYRHSKESEAKRKPEPALERFGPPRKPRMRTPLVPALDSETAEEIGAVDIPKAAIDFSRFPEFDEDTVTLVARDPDTLFAYWEVTFDAIDRHSRTTGDRTPPEIVLRIRDVANPDKHLDIRVNSRYGTYYLAAPDNADAFCAEIGIWGRSGFWLVARSSITHMPLGARRSACVAARGYGYDELPSSR